MRNIFYTVLVTLSLFATASAQVPATVHAIVSGGGTNNNVYSAIGQPFFRQ